MGRPLAKEDSSAQNTQRPSASGLEKHGQEISKSDAEALKQELKRKNDDIDVGPYPSPDVLLPSR